MTLAATSTFFVAPRHRRATTSTATTSTPLTTTTSTIATTAALLFGRNRGERLSSRSASSAVASASSSSSSSSDAATAAPPSSLPTFEGRVAWHGPELMRNPDEWTHVFTADEVAELDSALALAESRGLDVIQLDTDNFPLPTLAPRLLELRDELVEGRGIALMRGLPVHRYTSWQVCAAFYGMGAHLGWPCPQNAKGHVLGHVKDLGNDPDDPATRIYTTCAAQPFHTDSADVVGLLCVNNSLEGGESQVVSTVAIWNELVRTKPHLAEVLTQPFPVDRKGEVPPGKRPTYDMPIFHRHSANADATSTSRTSTPNCTVGKVSDGVDDVNGVNARSNSPRGESVSEGKGHGSGSGKGESEAGEDLLSGIYDRNFIKSAQARFTESDGVPRLTPLQIEALDALDALCDDDRLRLDMRLEPGDIQWLHNHTTLHARSSYTDGGPEPSRRHLLRLWITPPNARPLPPLFAERFGTTEVGPSRGGIRVEGQTPYCALEPGA